MKNIFDNTEVAFAVKTDAEIERAYFLFKIIQSEPMVKIGSKITQFALKAHLPVEGLIRATVFNHFCGGVTEEDCMPVIDKMYDKRVHSILDYSAEGKEEEAQFDKAVKITLGVIDFAREKDSMPFAVFKPTGFGRLGLYEKVSNGEKLTDDEKEEWSRVVARYDKVSKAAFEKNVPLLIDAEEVCMQQAVDDLVEQMMEKYNKEKAIVFGTLQLYRHDRMDYIKALHQRALDKQFHVGMKLVRGAYMEKERERAQEKGLEDPICKDKAATDKMYNDVMKYMFDNIDQMAIYVGTHNEDSAQLFKDLIDNSDLDKNDSRLWFGQLFGMSDHISYNLAALGYNVSKYLPFGPVKDVMPYLIRRADENTSVGDQTNRELELLKRERKRRKIQ
jgi:proline dehydrogenase